MTLVIKLLSQDHQFFLKDYNNQFDQLFFIRFSRAVITSPYSKIFSLKVSYLCSKLLNFDSKQSILYVKA